MSQWYECPECGMEVPVVGESERAVCADCGAKLVLEVDYDCVGDPPRWVDHTKWVVTETELAS